MNPFLACCCVLGAFSTACNSPDEDKVTCSAPDSVELEIGPFGVSDPIRTDLSISGTVALDADMVVYGIALAVYASASSTDDIVFDTPAVFTPPTTWSATVPLSKLLAPTHGAGTIKIRARATTNCEDVVEAESASFGVAPPADAGVDGS